MLRDAERKRLIRE